jgi:hypothetical protein
MMPDAGVQSLRSNPAQKPLGREMIAPAQGTPASVEAE